MALKLDGRTVRGRQWKEISNCGKPLKQGVLLPTKSCSFCHEAPDIEKETIQCMCCHSYFHISCLIKPLSEEFLNLVSTNPSIWWYCLGCLSSKSSAIQTSNAEHLPDGSMDFNDVVLQTTLMNFKSDVLTLVSETMENKFKSISALLKSERANKIQSPNVNTAPMKVNSSPPVSQSAWGNFGVASNGIASDNISSETPHPEVKEGKSTEKHVLLLQPNSVEVMGSTSAQKSSISSINHAISGINVNFCSVKKSGVVAIGFNDSETKKQAEDKIKRNEKLNVDFQTKYPKKMMPKITIKGINEVLFEGCHDNRDQMKEVLKEDIIDRNENIKMLLEEYPNESLTVVVVQKTMPSHSSVSYMAAVKMTSRLRKSVYDNGDKLYVSLKRCKVFDRYHVKQCYHCQQPGHISNNCPDKKANKAPTCFYCSKAHFSKDCGVKGSLEEQCCSNCLKSSNPAMIEGAKSHTSASPKCPVLQSYISSIKAHTENWSEKNILV